MNLDVPISTVMTKNVSSVGPDEKLVKVKHIFEQKNFHHHIPVTEENELEGMISLVDYLYAIKGASMNDDEEVYQTLKVREVMRPSPVCRSSSSTLREIVTELAKGEVHAIVIADDGKLKGIVSTADVLRWLLSLE